VSRSLQPALEGWEKSVPKKKVEIIPKGETDLAKGTLGRASRDCDAFIEVFKKYDAWPHRARDQWISGTSAALRHHAALLVQAFDALVAPRQAASKRTFDERLLDYAAQVDAVDTFGRNLNRALQRLLERRQGPEGVVELKLRGITSSMTGMGIDTSDQSSARGAKKR
jgi:hypothetical protein